MQDRTHTVSLATDPSGSLYECNQDGANQQFGLVHLSLQVRIKRLIHRLVNCELPKTSWFISREIRKIITYHTCYFCQMLMFQLEQENGVLLSRPIQQKEQLL
jgi:hypothetical protein